MYTKAQKLNFVLLDVEITHKEDEFIYQSMFCWQFAITQQTSSV